MHQIRPTQRTFNASITPKSPVNELPTSAAGFGWHGLFCLPWFPEVRQHAKSASNLERYSAIGPTVDTSPSPSIIINATREPPVEKLNTAHPISRAVGTSIFLTQPEILHLVNRTRLAPVAVRCFFSGESSRLNRPKTTRQNAPIKRAIMDNSKA